MIKIDNPLVSVNWLHNNFDAENLLILDATIAKVGVNKKHNQEKKVIKNAVFFDIKKVFSDKNSLYPNTVLTSDDFEAEAQKLGVYKDSCIVVYDDLGIYAAPRVWWLFNLMGFKNIAVLNGGFPAWKNANLPTENNYNLPKERGDFQANFQSEKIKYRAQVLSEINNKEIIIADARSKDRFYAKVAEPRKEVRGGHIPNSVSLPYEKVLENGKMKSVTELKTIFNKINPKKKEFIFSCGSGITACILALGATLANYKNHSVYDGSWTEWGSITELPIKK